MLRIPLASLALFTLGVIIGAIVDDITLGLALGGFGSLIGYAIWLRARIAAVKAGRAFHLGSVLNIFMCTFMSLGFGIVGISAPGDPNGMLLVAIPVVAVIVCWLHWHFATKVRLLPTGREIAREVVTSLFAGSPVEEGVKAVVEGGYEYGKDLMRRETA